MSKPSGALLQETRAPECKPQPLECFPYKSIKVVKWKMKLKENNSTKRFGYIHRDENEYEEKKKELV